MHVGRKDHLLGRIHPFALGIDAAAGLDGANHRVGGGNDVAGAFDDIFEGIAHGLAAVLHQTRGVGVAINITDFGDVEFFGDAVRRIPVQEVGLNRVAIGIRADNAFALVAFESGEFAAGGAGTGLAVRGFLA